MTRCAGTCSYSQAGRGVDASGNAFLAHSGCVIRLSEPLLKLRPAKDLKETLLHEMIHAYIFLNRIK